MIASDQTTAWRRKNTPSIMPEPPPTETVILQLHLSRGSRPAAAAKLGCTVKEVERQQRALDVLWKKYWSHPKAVVLRNRIAAIHVPWAEHLAKGWIKRQVRPQGYESDLALSAVYEALLERVENFDPKYGLPFHVYCLPRLKGAVQDEIRRCDHVRRDHRHASEAIEAAREKLAQHLGHRPTDRELAEVLGISESRLWSLRAPKLERPLGLSGEEGFPLSEMIAAAQSPRKQGEGFARLVRDLSPLQTTVLYMRFCRGMVPREIAAALSVSETWVRATLKGSLQRLRIIWEDLFS